MPINNPGYDFECKKGYKIDSKASCESKRKDTRGRGMWDFAINRNEVADYFVLLGFSSREDLSINHLWVIPGNVLRGKLNIRIFNTEKSLAKWSEFEKPVDKLVKCCNSLKDR
jgi:hypothetical protein